MELGAGPIVSVTAIVNCIFFIIYDLMVPGTPRCNPYEFTNCKKIKRTHSLSKLKCSDSKLVKKSPYLVYLEYLIYLSFE